MSGILPHWLENWLGVEHAGSGEGAVWSLENSWGWAPWVTLLFVVFAVGWVAYFYTRENAAAGKLPKILLAATRLTLITMVLLMVAELMLSLKRTGLPTVVVLIDDSGSMAVSDRYENEKLRALALRRVQAIGLKEPTRLNLAKSILLDDRVDLLGQLEQQYKLKVYCVAGAARSQPDGSAELRSAIRALEPTGETTRLGADLRSVLADLRGNPPAAIVLLTDGITTDGEPLSDAARYARTKGVPLFTVGLGDERPVRDLELNDVVVDEVAFVDDVLDFAYKLSATGLQGRTVEVTLREKDNPTVLARAKVVVGPDGHPQQLHLPLRPTQVGDFQYVIEVEHLKEESHADNNQQQRVVSVRKEQIRVLLVQSYPNYEFRYLKNMLERDNTIQLKTVLQDADLEYAEIDQSALRVFPVRRDELFEYDVILFGDVNPAFLSASVMANISAFVEEKGGGIAFISGPQYTPLAYRNTPLAALLPLDLSAATAPPPDQLIRDGFKIQPTEQGLLTSPQMQLGNSAAETAQIWQNLPPVYWLLECPQLKPAAQGHVLAEHPTRLGVNGRKLPVFFTQYVGAGKVLFHATDETWRWRFRVGDVFFARYWVQAIRYLSRSKLVGKDRSAELSADRRQYHRGESVRLRTRFIDERLAPAEDDGVTVVIEREGRANQRIKMQRSASSRGVFETLLPNVADGRYHAWLAAPTLEGKAPSSDFLVVAPPGEFERVQMDAAELTRAAEETRGRFYRLDQTGKLADDLPLGKQVPIESLPPIVLWNQWWMLATFLLLLVGEWVLRKRNGMV